MKTETPREIAERLAQNFNYAFRGSYVPSAYRDATTAIEAALKAERERCAKIAEGMAERYRGKSQHQKRRGVDSLSEHFLSECNASLEIAAEIRGTNAD